MGLNRKQLVENAVAATDCDDFGGNEWVEGLDVLLASLEEEADLNEVGVVVAETQIGDALRNRLRIIDWHRTHPELAEAPISAPIVIIGQPRTGTTILFDLLAQDRGLRAPLTWEVADPLPPPQTATYDTDPRIASSEAATSMTEAVIPGFQAIHPSGALRAQECVAITMGDFRSILWSTVFHVPTYTRWVLDEADLSSTYRYHRQFLQVLQSEHPGDRWLLKTPAHQWHLAEMFAEYPDAIVVQTHRDPLVVIASVTSLMSVLQKLATDEPSIPQLASEWVDFLVAGNDRSITARLDGTIAGGQAVDVAFADLMADRLETISALYDGLGRKFSDETAAAMEVFLAENARNKHGSHNYSFADTRLDIAATRELTATYESYFDVPREI
jgi:hypothetical protein